MQGFHEKNSRRPELTLRTHQPRPGSLPFSELFTGKNVSSNAPTHHLLLPLLLASMSSSAQTQSTGQSVKVTKGVVSQVENVEMRTEDNSGAGAVVGGAVGYNLGSGRSQSQKRRAAIVGAGVGATAGSSQQTLGVRYTVTKADGTTIGITSGDQLTIEVGTCVSVEQSRDRSSIREVDQAVCDLEAQTTPAAAAPAADTAPAPATAQSDKCETAQQQLLDATTAEEVEVANSKIKILCN